MLSKKYIDTPLTRLAASIAVSAHEGQKDKAGQPYIRHPEYVASQMPDEDTVAVALLHDVLEDTEIVAADLLDMGIPKHIVEAVKMLTRKQGESYFSYIGRVKSDRIATAVKVADLQYNMDLSRLPIVTDADKERRKKYEKALKHLLD